MKVGLFFGSFNPVHVGHLIIANFMASQTDLDQVWFVVTPQNPLKERSSLARDQDRLFLVRLAIEDNPLLKASNVEFDLPKPSYTIDTLTYLNEKHPSKEFVLIMGSDNIGSLHRWKNYEMILKNYSIYVYRRPEYEVGELADHPHVKIFDAPQMKISASYIRKCMKEGLNIKYLVTTPVEDYLESSSMYKKR